MAVDLSEKLALLRETILGYGHLAVAYSGGVDSALLAYLAREQLGEAAVAFIADSPTLPRRELESAVQFCADHDIKLVVFATHEFENAEYLANSRDRCYWCKRALFEELLARIEGYGLTIVAEGSNTDDLGDYRPGRKAIAEMAAVSPLLEADISKAEVRAISKELGLATWDKPSAACLASRLPYGQQIDVGVLSKVEQAEDFLHDLGFAVARVRAHGDLARIEVEPSALERLCAGDVRTDVTQRLHELGFKFVSVDMDGYRLGSLN
jgi:uncharacterized protein